MHLFDRFAKNNFSGTKGHLSDEITVRLIHLHVFFILWLKKKQENKIFN